LFKVALALVPPLLLIFLVLGSIIAGIATVNQAGAIGAIGAMLMAGYKLREGTKSAFYPAILTIASLLLIWGISSNYNLSVKTITETSDRIALFFVTIAVIGLLAGISWSGWRAFSVENTLRDVMAETAKTTSLVFIILLGAAMLTAAFRGFGGEEVVKHFLSSLPGGFWSQFIVVMLVIFVLGFFLDFIEIAVVVVPIVAPILLADPSANVTAVWLGVMIGLNIQTSFLTPPFGFALFYLRGVASRAVKTIDMYKGVVPFIGLQLIGLAIVGFNPSLVNYLPTKTFLSSETAPPPKNPRLQMCLENYLFNFYDTNQAGFNSQLALVNNLDYSSMPKSMQKSLEKNLRTADSIFELKDEIKSAKAEMAAASIAYKPIHTKVRSIERMIRQDEKQIKSLKLEMRAIDDPAKKAAIKEEIVAFQREIIEQKSLIPKTWKQTNKDFKLITTRLNKARMQFRRKSDQAYSEVRMIINAVEAVPKLSQISDQLRTVRRQIQNNLLDLALRDVKTIQSELSKVPGANDAVSLLSKARRSIDSKKPNSKKALSFIDDILVAVRDETEWREIMLTGPYTELVAFERYAKNNLGLREQDRLTEEQVDIIIPCLASHRDISLHF
jgi:TRAP-type C4-dicarboxylate transport system permease large subunit